jgi:hypothetical protein
MRFVIDFLQLRVGESASKANHVLNPQRNRHPAETLQIIAAPYNLEPQRHPGVKTEADRFQKAVASFISVRGGEP